VDEEDEVYIPVEVTLLVEIGGDVHFHRIMCEAPEFEISSQIVSTYAEMEGARIRIWHNEKPSELPPAANHWGSLVLQ